MRENEENLRKEKENSEEKLTRKTKTEFDQLDAADTKETRTRWELIENSPRLLEKNPNWEAQRHKQWKKNKKVNLPESATTKEDLNIENKGAAASIICALSIHLSQSKETIRGKYPRKISN